MPALTWVRVDAALARNPKTLHLLGEKGGDRALCVYIFGLGYCAEQGNDGFIVRSALPLIHGTPKTAEQLVSVGLWHDVPGGWDVNDYAEYQPTSEDVRQRSERARAAARRRWEAVR